MYDCIYMYMLTYKGACLCVLAADGVLYILAIDIYLYVYVFAMD